MYLEVVVLRVRDVAHVVDGHGIAVGPLALEHEAAHAQQLQPVTRRGEAAQAAVHQVHRRVEAHGRQPADTTHVSARARSGGSQRFRQGSIQGARQFLDVGMSSYLYSLATSIIQSTRTVLDTQKGHGESKDMKLLDSTCHTPAF